MERISEERRPVVFLVEDDDQLRSVTKRLLWESGSLSAADVERKETALHHHLMGRPDAREGVIGRERLELRVHHAPDVLDREGDVVLVRHHLPGRGGPPVDCPGRRS